MGKIDVIGKIELGIVVGGFRGPKNWKCYSWILQNWFYWENWARFQNRKDFLGFWFRKFHQLLGIRSQFEGRIWKYHSWNRLNWPYLEKWMKYWNRVYWVADILKVSWSFHLVSIWTKTFVIFFFIMGKINFSSEIANSAPKSKILRQKCTKITITWKIEWRIMFLGSLISEFNQSFYTAQIWAP